MCGCGIAGVDAAEQCGSAGTGGPGQNFRLYADQLKDTFGQSFVLENMPGGSGAIGSMTVARSAPDGHTLAMLTGGFSTQAAVVKTLPYHPLRDFAFVTTVVPLTNDAQSTISASTVVSRRSAALARAATTPSV